MSYENSTAPHACGAATSNAILPREAESVKA